MSQAHPQRQRADPAGGCRSAAEFEVLLAYLKQSRGFDFTAYKRASLMRRVQVRMQTAGIEAVRRLPRLPAGGPRGVHPALQHHPDQRHQLLPRPRQLGVPARRGPAGPHRRAGGAAAPIRVWSAGCASGEEAYSIAMLLAEAMGIRRVPRAGEDLRHRRGRRGAQPGTPRRRTARAPSRMSPPRCWSSTSTGRTDRFAFNKDLRRAVIFGRHDLIQDAPISRVDLLICRNCLMYFNTEAQARILARFHFALVPARRTFPGQGGDAAGPERHLRAGGRQAAPVRSRPSGSRRCGI